MFCIHPNNCSRRKLFYTWSLFNFLLRRLFVKLYLFASWRIYISYLATHFFHLKLPYTPLLFTVFILNNALCSRLPRTHFIVPSNNRPGPCLPNRSSISEFSFTCALREPTRSYFLNYYFKLLFGDKKTQNNFKHSRRRSTQFTVIPVFKHFFLSRTQQSL